MELPRLQTLWTELKDKNVRFLAVEVTRSEAVVQKFIRDNGLTYDFVEISGATDDFLENILHVHVYPTTMIVDKSGYIRYYSTGFYMGKEKEFQKEIEKLLN